MSINNFCHFFLQMVFLLVIGTFQMQAQEDLETIKDYTQYTDYFDKQKNQLQQVYDGLNTNQLLLIKDVLIFEDEVIVELLLNTSQDSSVAVWKNLQMAFEKSHHTDIENWLFIKMANSFDLPFGDVRIRIYNRTENGEIPNVDGRIVFEKEEGIIKAKGFDYRTRVKGEIELRESEISSNLHFVDLSWEDVQSLQDIREKMYTAILEGAQAHFKDKVQDVEKDIIVESHRHLLNFRVANIQDEIVKKGSGLFSKYMAPFERICFSINISLNQNDKTVFCAVDIDGKYGSSLSFLQPSAEGNYVDMYPDYKADLDKYIKTTFEPLLREWLSNN